MHNGVTILELFVIGFSFGLAGPCLLVCTPVLVSFVAGKRDKPGQAIFDIAVFLSGRLLAYLLLGFLAGLSGLILRQFVNSGLVSALKLIGGIIIILLGVYVWLGKGPVSRLCKHKGEIIFNSGSLFSLGFIVGIFPCAPLLALLLEIALISRSAIGGMAYALSFGLGTFVSGFIAVGALAGIFTWLAARTLKTKTAGLIFKAVCALLLILLGLNLIFKSYS